MSIESSPPPSNAEKYVVSDSDHELVQKFQPEYLARGGEHIVYGIPSHPELVAKVAIEPMKRLITHNIEGGHPPDYLGKEERQKAEHLLQNEAERFAQLRKYFSKDHTLGQKKYLMKVPVTPELLQEIFKEDPPATPKEAYSMVVIQKVSRALEDPQHLALIGGEMEEVSDDIYRQQTKELIIHPDQSIFNREEFIQLQAQESMEAILTKCDTDPTFRAALQDFIERSIDYTSETGEILDLAGEDNVVFYTNDEKSSYELIDALYPAGADMVNRVHSALANIEQGQEPEDYEYNDIFNTIQYVRTINGLAAFLGTSKRIKIVPENINSDKILDFLVTNR